VSAVVVVLGAVWGAVVAAPLVHRARRVAPVARGAARGAPHPSAMSEDRPRLRRLRTMVPVAVARPVAELRQRRRTRRIEQHIEHELPVTVDLLAVAVGAGCTPYLAVDVAGRWAPPTVAAELDGVIRACALGRSFADALDDLAARLAVLQPLVDALLASDRFGAAVGDALLRLGAEQRAVLRRRAETRARTVPVRLLFPLVFLVLPAFGLLTVVPAVLAGFDRA
jgi:tight adherence protein C